MKFFTLTLRRAAIAGFLLASITVGIISADPSDDFRFTLHSAEAKRFSVMSEKQVTEVLLDRLDLFPVSQIPDLGRHLVALCRQYRFDPAFVLSLIEVESGFRVRVISPAGAVGLMQMMPPTVRAMSEALSSYAGQDGFLRYARILQLRKGRHATSMEFKGILQDPFVNVEFGVAYLAWLRDRYRDLSPYYLVAAYNVGPAKMDELLSRKTFKPVSTKRYYEAIRRMVPQMRDYRRPPEEI